ncbi:unnamed protein product [Medioppia subpectinata]|uniref:Uncharacterized protein n=1 Tax=Medioppia subpectinata TaxID=1979941 RepID=A0A7R9L3B2_9ACAR|nr:unnamed protein product [Medioppia subpectinata]CAG2114515.1 unnamed protein product [Medioppia subpectinata]
MWDMKSCMKGAVIKWSRCRPTSILRFSKDIDTISARTDYQVCHQHYTEDSIRCGIPVWLIVAMVLMAILILIVITCFARIVCRRRQRTDPIEDDSIHFVRH